MSLFNDSMGKPDKIMAFWSRFDCMVIDMARCKIVIPPIFLAMFFLRLLHSCYDDLLEQFCSRCKSLEGASLNLIVADVRYHDQFKLVGSDKKIPPEKVPKAAAAAASTHVDNHRKAWSNPYEWPASFNIKSVK
jgi:hypothetical protein